MRSIVISFQACFEDYSCVIRSSCRQVVLCEPLVVLLCSLGHSLKQSLPLEWRTIVAFTQESKRVIRQPRLCSPRSRRAAARFLPCPVSRGLGYSISPRSAEQCWDTCRVRLGGWWRIVLRRCLIPSRCWSFSLLLSDAPWVFITLQSPVLSRKGI